MSVCKSTSNQRMLVVRAPQAGGPELGRNLLAVAQQTHLFRAPQLTFGKRHREGHRLAAACHALPLYTALGTICSG